MYGPRPPLRKIFPREAVKSPQWYLSIVTGEAQKKSQRQRTSHQNCVSLHSTSIATPWTIPTQFVTHNFKSKRCEQCGFEYYFNAAAAVAAVVVTADGYLLTARRSREPAQGTLDLPGGFVDAGETLEQAVVRELREETGLSVTPRRWLLSLPNRYVYSGLAVATVDSFFLCDTDTRQPMHAQDDVSQLQWLKLEEVRPEEFGLDSIRQAVTRIKEMPLSQLLDKQ